MHIHWLVENTGTQDQWEQKMFYILANKTKL